MIRVFDVAIPLDYTHDSLVKATARALNVPIRDIESMHLRRQAVDARKKSEIKFICTVDAALVNEQSCTLPKSVHRVIPAPDESYKVVISGTEKLKNRPIVVGSGPAGLFAALTLAQAGYMPLVLERGKSVDERCHDVETFWRSGTLDTTSNAQFGEGGAGTFSDGKLTTLINDIRCRKVLDEFVKAGASADILTKAKPHIGTDQLRSVVKTMRAEIIRLGGEFRFSTPVTGIRVAAGVLKAVEVHGSDEIACDVAVFAIGHSARDTFVWLYEAGMPMLPKPFSVGVRIEHPQSLIDVAQYGVSAGHRALGAADYKLAYHAESGRSAYTFCMCPGGEVIAAASQAGGVVTNGMSYAARNGRNSNAALLVNVTPDDFLSRAVLAGFAFQEIWERKAFELGGRTYYAPVQLLRDFMAQRASGSLGSVAPTYRPGVVPSSIDGCLPDFVTATLRLALPVFGRQLRGFDMPDALLTGVETRSSSPVRMVRNETGESPLSGIYPCGEGAGFAGGITSAAVDGIKTAESIIRRFALP